jgi:glycosyltransferase involved in cell wall biosynthesis
MIRILHLTTDSKIAGAERLLIGIAKEYDKTKFELFFCVLKKRGDLNQEIENFGLKTFSLNCKSFLDAPRAVLNIIFILKKYRINILHTHLFHAGILGHFAALFVSKTLVLMTRHYSNYTHLYGTAFQRLLNKWSLRVTKYIIAVSYGVLKALTQLEVADPKKILVIHNGIDLNQFNLVSDVGMKTRDELNIRKNVKIIGAIGTLHPRKGHEYFVRAADIVCRKRKDVKFIIIGDGVAEKRLIELRDSLGLREKIIFTGYRKDAPYLLSMMDILVQPSLEEGFGLTIIEAMVLSKAVIATNVGGIPEIVEDKVSGLLVPEKSPEAIAQAIDYLLDNSAKMKQLGINAKLRVFDKFSLPSMVKKYEIVYEELINKYHLSAKTKKYG